MTGDNSGIVELYDRWAAEEADRRDQQERLKELFSEAKDDGFNTKALRAAFRQRFDDEYLTDDQREKRATNDADTDVYLSALARVRTRGADSDGSEYGNMIITHSPAPDPSGSDDAPGDDPHTTLPGATESTAARMDVPEVTRSGKLGNVIGGDSDPAAPELTDVCAPGSKDPKPESGYQAPPVDTQPITEIQRVMERVQGKSFDPSTHFLNSQGLKRLHGCQRPEACGSEQPRVRRCHGCQLAYAEEHGETA